MLIPSIDLMGGKIVQLVQGERKALEFDNFGEWMDRFSRYPLVQLIDLDAAMGSGNNTAMIRDAASRLPCQVGGGMRSIGAVEAALAAGARKVIVGSALFARGHLDWSFASKLAAAVGSDRLVFALDARGGRVVIHGWRTITEIKPLEMIQALDRWSGAFLYTHVDTEGSLQGFPQKVLQPLRKATSRQLIAAGGIRSKAEVDALHAMGVDAVVGMAIYTGLMPA